MAATPVGASSAAPGHLLFPLPSLTLVFWLSFLLNLSPYCFCVFPSAPLPRHSALVRPLLGALIPAEYFPFICPCWSLALGPSLDTFRTAQSCLERKLPKSGPIHQRLASATAGVLCQELLPSAFDVLLLALLRPAGGQGRSLVGVLVLGGSGK